MASTLLNNLVAYWKLDGNSTDATGNGHNGTDTNITYGTSCGKINQGASLNGSSSYIEANSIASFFNEAQSVSVSAWVKTTTGGYILTASYTGTFNNPYFAFDTSGFYCGAGGANNVTGVADGNGGATVI